jgi:EAL domain-containing protein (putative c-di-GMP-specific phosphodiesterase class I)
VTEHSEVEDYGVLRRALAPLRGHVRIAVDDVGAGYAGLRHILDLQPDVLKLDIGLTRDIDRDPARRALAAAMVRFAADIDASIVAEGIERDGERRALADLGVGHGQGWLFSRALPPVAASQRLLGPVWTPPPAERARRRAAIRSAA